MKPNSILIVDTYYPAFLHAVGFSSPNRDLRYSQALEQIMQLNFGTSDAYSTGLTNQGWDAQEVIPNSLTLQSAWARENKRHLWTKMDKLPPSYLSRVPGLSNIWSRLPSLHHILECQIESADPKVVYFQDLNFAPTRLLRRLRRENRLVVGQIASPLPPKDRLQHFDLILSSLPNQVEQISSMRISSEFLPIAFDTRIIDKLPELNRDIPISFVGGISKYHGSTIPLLQAVVNEVEELQIFGYGANSLGDIPTLQARHHGECWALEMYKVLGRSVATLNRHISISENYANNMRLFEATGVGALLITDSKQNISDYFTPGEEILTYANPNEAAELARWAVNNPDEATVIAKKGQQKTLSQHTYERCMVTLDGILKKYL